MWGLQNQVQRDASKPPETLLFRLGAQFVLRVRRTLEGMYDMRVSFVGQHAPDPPRFHCNE